MVKVVIRVVAKLADGRSVDWGVQGMLLIVLLECYRYVIGRYQAMPRCYCSL